MKTPLIYKGLIALTVLTSAPVLANEWPFDIMSPEAVNAADSYVGTVRARDMHGLSYRARGCIVDVSEDARYEQVAKAGQMLVKLDGSHVELALQQSQARLADLQAALEQRDLDIAAAEAASKRRVEELSFVSKEFDRNQTMFRRGLINETTMEGVERRMMDARFAADQAQEAMQSARSARARAEIALDIGQLEVRTAEVDREMLTLTAPFDGVLVGFEASEGACVSDGALAGQIYDPKKKSVDLYILISRLSAPDSTGVSRGTEVTVRRGNGQSCGGTVTWIDTQADLESQYVETTVDVEETCASGLFLNEAVEVDVKGSTAYRVPATALLDGMVYVVEDGAQQILPISAQILRREGDRVIARIPSLADRRIIVDAMSEGIETYISPRDPS